MAINKIILDTLNSYMGEHPEIPKDFGNLIEKLLKIEDISGNSSGGIDKLYDQLLERFISNRDLIEWGKEYVK
jgi:hypothetical protein